MSTLYVGVGIHPSCFRNKFTDCQEFRSYAQHKVVAIGEIGLDYYRNFQSPSIQKKCFDLLEVAADITNSFLHHRDAFKISTP